jgi:hypothetical protein
MKTLQLTLSERQYEQLQREAQERKTVIDELVLEAVEAFLNSATIERKERYTRLDRKQAAWRDRLPDSAQLDNLRLDLIYHSEALEGNPLTKDEMKEAIEEHGPA